MEERNQLNTMLQLLPQPAFLVEEGVISHVNQAASAFFLQPGQLFIPMLLAGAEEYAEFTAGCLYVTLSVADQRCGACVTRMSGCDIVTLEQAAELPHLQAMALAATALLRPINGILSLSENFLPAVAQKDEMLHNQAAQMNRRLHQLLRLARNMSDAPEYAKLPEGRMEGVDICIFLAEILEKTAALAAQAGICIHYELPDESIFTMADVEKLERAVYNLLSNAIKFSPENAVVRVKLIRKHKRVHISVTNCQRGVAPQGDIFQHFLRKPALEDPQNGIGLGMVLVRATAALHGGAILLDQTDDGIRFTMSLPIRRSDRTQLRTPIMGFDYAGEHDHCLLELSDVLPASVYEPEYK